MGTGAKLTANVLSIGEHLITVTGTDSVGNTVKEVAHLLISPTNLPSPEIQTEVMSVLGGDVELGVREGQGDLGLSTVPVAVWQGLGGLALLLLGIAVGLVISRRLRRRPSD